MIPAIVHSDFPDIVSNETEEIECDHKWYEKCEHKVAWEWDKESYSFVGPFYRQANADMPGEYWEHPHVLEQHPEEVCGAITDEQEYFYNIEKKNWDVRPNIYTVPVYNKRDKTLVRYPNEACRWTYTHEAPPSALHQWSDEENTWVLSDEELINGFKRELTTIKGQFESEEIDFKGKKVPGLDNFNNYVMLNASTDEGEVVTLFNNDDELVELTKSDLVEVINLLKKRRLEGNETFAAVSRELDNVKDQSQLFSMLEAKPKSRSTLTDIIIQTHSKLIDSMSFTPSDDCSESEQSEKMKQEQIEKIKKFRHKDCLDCENGIEHDSHHDEHGEH